VVGHGEAGHELLRESFDVCKDQRRKSLLNGQQRHEASNGLSCESKVLFGAMTKTQMFAFGSFVELSSGGFEFAVCFAAAAVELFVLFLIHKVPGDLVTSLDCLDGDDRYSADSVNSNPKGLRVRVAAVVDESHLVAVVRCVEDLEAVEIQSESVSDCAAAHSDFCLEMGFLVNFSGEFSDEVILVDSIDRKQTSTLGRNLEIADFCQFLVSQVLVSAFVTIYRGAFVQV
jgi:hypothetical protein